MIRMQAKFAVQVQLRVGTNFNVHEFRNAATLQVTHDTKLQPKLSSRASWRNNILQGFTPGSSKFVTGAAGSGDMSDSTFTLAKAVTLSSL
jgi:hypothetical protein